MRILVCVKQVSFLYSRMGVDPTGKIDPDSLIYILNPYDETALEEALRIKEKREHVQVTLISMGLKRVEESLRYGLAMGADQAILLCGEKLENVDPFMRARALAKIFETNGFDLILFGKKAIDDNEGLVGGFVAEFLGLPFVASVTTISIEADGKQARMLKVLERGDRQLVECVLPAVFSVEKGLTKPRYPTLMGRLTASKKEVSKVDPEELGIGYLLENKSERKVVNLSISRPKPKKIFTPDSNLPAEERIKLIMSGGLQEKKSDFLKGAPQTLARRYVEFLEENRIIKRQGR